jgi:hypothetical protein
MTEEPCFVCSVFVIFCFSMLWHHAANALCNYDPFISANSQSTDSINSPVVRRSRN